MKTDLPRLGETANEVWKKFVELSQTGVVSEGGRVHYPHAIMVGEASYIINADGLCKSLDGGFLYRKLTDAEKGEFHLDLNADRLNIHIQTKPGYESDYKTPRVIKVLHTAHGHSFTPKQP